jgi:hypothetical protein
MLKIGKGLAIAVMAAMSTSTALAWGIQHDMPKGMTHEQHLEQMKKEAAMKERGKVAMGFDQDQTTHHFWLTNDGGMIQVESTNSSDTASRDLIRSHLKAIRDQFAQGDFSAPLMTHNETPPGVPTMKRLKAKIAYSFEERPSGAVVRISSVDKKAVRALHRFLQYQIKEHATGDPLTVSN